MSDGTLFKPDKDFSKDADKILPEAESLAKGDLRRGIDKILALEKQARQASDLATTSRCLVAIVTLCKQAGDWSQMNEQVLLLSKKHGQLKQAITNMVQVVMGFLDDTPNLETKLSVIETLRTVTEGKVRQTGRSCSSDSHFDRSSWKSSGPESLGYCPTSRKSRVTSNQHAKSSANYKSRRSDL